MISHEINSKNVYLKLANLESNAINRITCESGNYGISPHAIWALSVSPICKIILLYLASKLNPIKSIINQSISIHISDIANGTSCNQEIVHKKLNKLIKSGYIRKIQNVQENDLNRYYFTSKIFNEYMIKLIKKENADEVF